MFYNRVWTSMNPMTPTDTSMYGGKLFRNLVNRQWKEI